jgi:hypothetical protein
MEINFDNPFLQSLLVGISSLLTYLLPPVKNWVNYKLGRMLPSLFVGEKKKVFQQILKLNDIIYSIEALPNVKKAVLIETKNGGGIPKAGSEVRGTVVMPHKWNEFFNNQVIDREYAHIILQTLDKKYFSYNVSDLPKDTSMRNMWDVQGVKSCYTYEMEETRRKYSFLSVEFDCELSDISTEVKENLRVKTSSFKEELKK